MPTNKQVARKIRQKYKRKTVTYDFSILIPFFGDVKSPYDLFSKFVYNTQKELHVMTGFHEFLIGQLQGGRIDANI